MKDRLKTPSFRSPIKRRGLAPPQALDTEVAEKELEKFRRTQPISTPDEVEALQVRADDLKGDSRHVKRLVVVHGESGEIPLDEAYPSKRAGHVAVGDFVVDLVGLNQLDPLGFPDPATIEHAVDAGETKTFIMPSTCVEYAAGLTFADGWRLSLRQHLASLRCDTDTLEQILREFATDGATNLVSVGSCPHTDDGCMYDARPGADGELQVDPAGGNCPKCQTAIHVADALRLHRELQQEGTNGTVFSRLREAVVHLIQWHYVNAVGQNLTQAFDDTAFLIMGPHAIFGATAAGLKTTFVERYKSILAAHTPPPLLIGLYTDGAFADHARQLKLTPGTVLELPRTYIAKHIVVGASEKWGKDTYYGTPFIYRTRKGHPCAFTLPYRANTGSAPNDYVEMPRALRLLDDLIDHEDAAQTTIPALVEAKGTVDSAAACSILKVLAGQ